MEYEQIISEITSGLTGNNEKDIAYLKAQADKYQSHDLAAEISRAINRLLYDILPEDQKAQAASFNSDGKSIELMYQEVKYLVSSKQNQKAAVLLDSLLELCESSVQPDDQTDYFSFKNMFQALLYEHIFKPQKTYQPAPHDCSDMYIIRGYLYLAEYKLDKAIEAMEKAISWNPVNIYAYFQLAEAKKLKDSFEEYYNLTKQALMFATTNAEIARCYRNFGFYFIEVKQYQDAINMYYLSRDYENHEAVASELFYISQQTGEMIVQPAQDEILETITRENIQVGPSEAVVGIATELGKKAYEDEHYDLARYCLSMVYGLTQDQEARVLLEKMSLIN
ncbi:MAG: hypothetical protein ACOX0T_11080 [Pelotomaculum sp.]|jgi:Tfp pilus assembly protein PilF